jgi:hypothetical protein
MKAIDIFYLKISIQTIYILDLTLLSLRILFRIFREGAYALRAVFLISWIIRPKLQIMVSYLMILPAVPDFGPVSSFINSVRSGQEDESFGRILIPKKGNCRLIESVRVRILQAGIIKRLYASWFGIVCSNEDVKILSAFGDSGWLTYNLLRAAGVNKSRGLVLNGEARRRITTVFKPFVRSLDMYLQFEKEKRITGGGKTDGMTANTRKCLLSGRIKEAVVTADIYPVELEAERLKVKRENILSFKHKAIRQMQIASEYRAFSNYLKILLLVGEGRKLGQSTIKELMEKLKSQY